MLTLLRPHCVLFLFILVAGCKPSAPVETPKPVAQATESLQTNEGLKSTSCGSCHTDVFENWKGTDHALANRMPDEKLKAVLATFPGGPIPESPEHPLMILGHKPLWQPLVPKPGGRWQAHEIAADSETGRWFNVFGTEDRREGEWGHWTGRGMNWNSMCAQCHMTGYKPGYDVATDTYHPTWIEMGVGCVQCHGEPPKGHASAYAQSAGVTVKEQPIPYDPFRGDRSLAMDTCAPCHARQEMLTTNFKPGEKYDDHYRMVLPVQQGVYYPDGQQRDEDFNWTSVRLSRMGHAGVTCMDCHDPHTSKTILPVENNAICMQCHAAPGRVMPSGIKSIPIDPVAHSHHAEGSVGNQCVSCHMPTTRYMNHADRHDHGWLKPDPLLTKELGIPNACSRCHEKEGIDWVIAKADEWYGDKLDSQQRARARAVAAAQAGDPASVKALLNVILKEDIPAWRATCIDLLTPASDMKEVRAVAEQALKAVSPLERAAGVRLLGLVPDARSLIRPLLNDPVRLVRIDAAWALSAELPEGSAARRELEDYFDIARDQPAGLARVGMDLANRGKLPEAEVLMERASQWDQGSPGIQEMLGHILIAQNKPKDAAVRFSTAAKLSPDNAQFTYSAALAYAEAGDMFEAENSFRLTVKRNPNFDRAWYNLGLLLSQKGDTAGALDALAKAEAINPQVADYPFATATLYLRLGDRAAAAAAARRTLAIDRMYPGAMQMLTPLAR